MSAPNRIPYLHGAPLGRARFKACPEDFVVEEVLGFEPSGTGEHCLLWVEKRGLESNAVAARIADRLGIRRRLVSHCGLKDRAAVTRQWFSVHLPGQPSPEAAAFDSEGLRVLEVTRNTRKLRRGTHAGNRFKVRLRDPEFGQAEASRRWSALCERGAPNVFGPQRFGHGGRNLDKALAMFRGEFVTRDRLLRGLLLSAARSHLFNAVVAERLARRSWERPLDGEVFGFAGNRSLVLPGNRRGDEADRIAKGVLELTAPLWGSGELQSGGEVRQLEREVAARHPELTAGLEAAGLRQERRVIRLRPREPGLEFAEGGDLLLRFGLPKGTYATSLLREIVVLVEGSPMFSAVETPQQIATCADLARRIWEEHYTPIIGEEQVAYMLAKLQTPEAIARQIRRDGARYYLIGEQQGYLAFDLREGVLFLSKIYLTGPERGSGLGRRAFDFVVGEARSAGCTRIELTVNRGNASAIAAYERWGMTRTGEKLADIGGGFVMDDYVYEFAL